MVTHTNKHNLHAIILGRLRQLEAILLKRNGPSLIRILSGMGLFVAGIASIALIFSPTGLLIAPDDKPFFLITIFAISTTIVSGAWLLSGYPLKRYLEPLIIGWAWFLFGFSPLFYIPIPKDTLYVILGLSAFEPILMWIGYSKLKARYQKGKTLGTRANFR